MKKIFKRVTAVVAAAAMCLTALPGLGVSAAATRTITATSDGNGTASATPTSLAPGESYTLTATPNPGYEFDHWEVTDDGSGADGVKRANIAFVLDVSVSMDSYIRNVKNNLESFVLALNDQGVTANFSVIPYEKSATFYTYASGSNWTTNTSDAVGAFEDILYDGTDGAYERTTEALKHLVNSNGTINFPSSLNNYVFILTDEACDEYEKTDSNSSDPGRWPLSKFTDIFSENNVRVAVVAEDKNWCHLDGYSKYYEERDCFNRGYDDIVKRTNGTFININSKDYYKLMLDYAKFISDTVITVNETYTSNPCTAKMPDCNIIAKAFFKAKDAPSAYNIKVITEGRGTAYASRATALPGQQVSIGAKPESGWKLDSITSSDVSINGNSFVMPANDVTIYVRFVEDYTKYIMTGRPHSYIYSYDGGELIATNCNRKFIENSESVVITVKLGEEYAGRSCTLYTGRKSSGGTALEKAVLDSKGRAEFTVEAGKNFHLIVNE